jgi:hypothetical protein
MRRLGVRFTIRRLMIIVAVVALLLGSTIQAWRWHKYTEFQRRYRLYETINRGIGKPMSPSGSHS